MEAEPASRSVTGVVPAVPMEEMPTALLFSTELAREQARQNGITLTDNVVPIPVEVLANPAAFEAYMRRVYRFAREMQERPERVLTPEFHSARSLVTSVGTSGDSETVVYAHAEAATEEEASGAMEGVDEEEADFHFEDDSDILEIQAIHGRASRDPEVDAASMVAGASDGGATALPEGSPATRFQLRDPKWYLFNDTFCGYCVKRCSLCWKGSQHPIADEAHLNSKGHLYASDATTWYMYSDPVEAEGLGLDRPPEPVHARAFGRPRPQQEVGLLRERFLHEPRVAPKARANAVAR